MKLFEFCIRNVLHHATSVLEGGNRLLRINAKCKKSEYGASTMHFLPREGTRTLLEFFAAFMQRSCTRVWFKHGFKHHVGTVV